MYTKFFRFLNHALILSAVLSIYSCVSTKQFQEVQDQNEFLKEENLNLSNARKERDQMLSEKETLRSELQSTKDLLKSTSANFMGIQSSYEELQAQYDLLSQQNKQLLRSTAGEKSALEEQIAKKQDDLDRRWKAFQEQEATLKQQQEAFEGLKSTISVRENQILELNSELEAQQTALRQLRSTISDALSSFSANELQIEQKENGKVYVSLSQDLLFQKGSNQIDEKGKSALIKLAEVLAKQKDLDIVVEGHADSDGSVSRNWDLSVARATEVVKILQGAGVTGEQLTASGRSFYAPVMENDSEENKSKNRRTEIIISPDLHGLFKLIRDPE